LAAWVKDKRTYDHGLDFLSPRNSFRLGPRISALLLVKYVGDMAGDMGENERNPERERESET
jgi:hypothetical protein